MRARLLVVGMSFVGALALALGLAMPIGAQSPIDGAIATLAIATARAQQWQQSQAATRQAQSIEATRQFQVAIATQTANDALATRQVIDAVATRQAIEATAQAQDAQARATRAAIDFEATRAAYEQAEIVQARQERSAQITEVFLYLAFGLGLAGLVFILWRVYLALRAIERKAATPPAEPNAAQPSDDGEVIDGETIERNKRGLDFEIITDPVSIQMFEDYVLEHGK